MLFFDKYDIICPNLRGDCMELKKPYIYLIPDSAGKKMLYLLQPLAMKMVIIVFFGLTCGFIVFRPSLFSYVSALFSITSYGIMFTAGSIWSIRLMKRLSLKKI